jgi:hypothetical protein
LGEEDMEDEVEGEGAEVDEAGDEAPVLFRILISASFSFVMVS